MRKVTLKKQLLLCCFLLTYLSALSQMQVLSVLPANGATNVNPNTAVRLEFTEAIQASTLQTGDITIVENGVGPVAVTGYNLDLTRSALTVVKDGSFKENTTYTINVLPAFQDINGNTIQPFSSTFTTGNVPLPQVGFNFEKILIDTRKLSTSLVVGPDNNLYVAFVDGLIKRYVINPATGMPVSSEVVFDGTSLQYQIIGILFDPNATPSNLQLWISYSVACWTQINNTYSGEIARLTIPPVGSSGQTTKRTFVQGLPRAQTCNHQPNKLAFDAQGNMYQSVGGLTTLGGSPNWGVNEQLLSGAVLKYNMSHPAMQGQTPLNVRTTAPVNYNPFAANAPVTIYATGLRNALDLVFHSNGRLYSCTNQNSLNGSDIKTPACGNGVAITARPNEMLYIIQQGKYYGHPNSLRGECVLNGGNPTAGNDPFQVPEYPVGTQPDPDFDPSLIYNIRPNGGNSANGMIEYKGNGPLKGRLLVAYFTGARVINTFAFGTNGRVIDERPLTFQNGTTITFDGALDVTTHPQTGHLYVADFGLQVPFQDGTPQGGSVYLLRGLSQNCTTPTGLFASNVTNSSAILNWTNDGAGLYDVRYRATGGAWITLNSLSGISVSIAGLSPSTTYEWQVRGVCGQTPTPYSSLASFNTPSGTGCNPQTLIIQAEDLSFMTNGGGTIDNIQNGYTGSGYFDMGGNGSWVQYTMNLSGGQQILNIRYANGSTGNRSCTISLNGIPAGNLTFPPTGSWTTWLSTQLTLNASAGVNTLRITASGSAGGPNIDRLEFTGGCSDTVAPSVPTGLSYTNQNSNALLLSWSPSTDDNEVTGYEVFQNGVSIGTTQTASMLVSGLNCETTYALRVRATDGSGNWSAQSAPLNATTGSCNVIVPQPGALSFSANGGTQSVTFTISTNWVIAPNQPWINVSPLSGTGNANLTVTVSSNPTSFDRTGVITVGYNGRTTDIPVTQSGTLPSVDDRYEGEAFTAQTGGTARTDFGTTFYDFGGNGSWEEWSNVIVPAAGTYAVTFRFGNGSGANRQCALIVNGIGQGNIPFSSNSSWNLWQTVTLSVPLNSGNNTIRLTANTGAGGPNLDYMDVMDMPGVQIDRAPAETATLQNVTLYPNPGQHMLTIKGVPSSVTVSITDRSGHLIKSLVMSDEQLDVSGLAPGIYLININDRIIRFVKE